MEGGCTIREAAGAGVGARTRRARIRPLLAGLRTACLAAALAAGALAPERAGAQSCSFTSATAIAFGAYDPFSAAPADSTGTLSWRCPPGQGTPRILLGTGSSGTFAWRELRQGVEALRYNLFLDAARTQVWGDGSGGTFVGPDRVRGGGGGVRQTTVYARIPAGQDPRVGTYTDVVVVTFVL